MTEETGEALEDLARAFRAWLYAQPEAGPGGVRLGTIEVLTVDPGDQHALAWDRWLLDDLTAHRLADVLRRDLQRVRTLPR